MAVLLCSSAGTSLALSTAVAPSAGASTPNRATLSTGWSHACALLANGTAKCWGDNSSGELGNGTTVSSSTPVAVKGLTNAVAISAGGYYTCALLGNKTVKCWGSNGSGQLGTGTTSPTNKPVAVKGLTNVVAVSTSPYATTCALLGTGIVKCWGENSHGQLGIGTKGHPSLKPLAVHGLAHATGISAGFFQSCAVIAGGTAKCWGANFEGQLGNGTTTLSTLPVAVSGLTNVSEISTGNSDTCARLTDGTARCWGNDILGGLGNGALGNFSSLPVVVSGLNNVAALTTANAYAHRCAVLTDGTARCWGYNGEGELGDGATPIVRGCPPGCSSVPVVVSGVTGAAEISNGYEFSCALSTNGAAKCWGLNDRGQLGNGNRTNQPIAVAVPGTWRV